MTAQDLSFEYRQRAAEILMYWARVEGWPWDREEQLVIARAARKLTHPDHNNGDRAGWDQVDWAINVLGLRISRSVN